MVQENNKTKITYYGHAMFEIESGSGVKIVTDPYNEKIKSILPEVYADIVLVSHDHFDHNNVSIVKGNPKIVKNTGTANVVNIKDIEIETVESFHDPKGGALRGKNNIYEFLVDKILFVHLGDLGHTLENWQLAKLKNIDVLMIPVGGTYTINFLEAYDLIKKISPKIAIPMHYKEPDSKLDVDTVEMFLSRCPDFKKVGHSIYINKDEINKILKTEIWVFDSK